MLVLRLHLKLRRLQMENKRTIATSEGHIHHQAKLGGNFKQEANPQFIKHRCQFFSRIKERQEALLDQLPKPQIFISLKDGKVLTGQAFKTTPFTIARDISRNLAEAVVVARVLYTKRYNSPWSQRLSAAEAEDHVQQEGGAELVDVNRPLEGDCSLELLTFQDKAGKEVFWHSSAHLLGQSLESGYGAWLCHGPPLQHGFFYDSFVGDYRFTQQDYQGIEKRVKQFVQEKQPYERIILTKQQALELFQYNPFKVQLIQNKVQEGTLTSAYKCGNLIDLCMGPHIPSADRIKGFKVTKHSAAYWLGNKQNDDLQRVYAMSFPKQSQLDDYFKQQEEMLKRDHRTIGPKQQLFNFTNLSPGSALFYPHGATIYNRLVELMRSEYRIRGYSQVISPNIYNSQIFKISGHYFVYKTNMFFLKDDTGEENGLKPMNCPGHCAMFDMVQHSYRDLPIRYADFGVLHRNELHGALSGLTRVRRFQQDDAHIFCRGDQIEKEILGVLDLLDYIYSLFGFKYLLELSTRPKEYLGSIEEWNQAEAQLNDALKIFGKPFKINQGDGAFYGPKIDVKLFDVFGRQYQCGTVQLDFQLPLRFNLQYRIKEHHDQEEDKQGKQTKQIKNKGEKPSADEIQKRKKEKEEKKKLKQTQKEQQKKPAKQEEANKEVPPLLKKEESLEEMEARYAKIGHLKKGFARPVIVHRAIFGSLERFIAILCEHTGGKWDFWLSPRQLVLIPMNAETIDFTEQVYNTFLLKNFSVQIDRSGDNFNKKIRNAVVNGFNYIGVIGNEEVKNKVITLRRREDDKEMGKFTVEEIFQLFEKEKPAKSKRRLEIQEKSIH